MVGADGTRGGEKGREAPVSRGQQGVMRGGLSSETQPVPRCSVICTEGFKTKTKCLCFKPKLSTSMSALSPMLGLLMESILSPSLSFLHFGIETVEGVAGLMAYTKLLK